VIRKRGRTHLPYGSVDDRWDCRVRLNGADHQWGKDPLKEVVG